MLACLHDMAFLAGDCLNEGGMVTPPVASARHCR